MHHLTQNALKLCIRSPRLRAAGVTLALSAAFFASQMLSSNPAFAQAACGDETCGKGFTCETAQGACDLSCRVPASGEGCEPCDAQDVQYCAPAPCSADADCGVGMLCAEQINYDCPTDPGTAPTDPDCPPDSDCAERVAADEASPSCTTTTVKICTPRWELPCTTASDCGPGFTCEETENCSSPGCSREEYGTCSTEVTCVPTGTFSCVMVQTACTSDANCEEGWTCNDNGSGTCSSSSDGQTSCEPANPAKLCTPPYAYSAADSRAVLTTGSSSDGLAETSAPNDDDNASVSSGGGCSIDGAPTQTSGAGFSLVGIAAAWALARRRRADKSSVVAP
jgi:MYXO-CTERM domain-containing protein